MYTRNDIKTRVNGVIKGKKDILIDFDRTINFGVREVLTEVDVRSTRKKVNMVPGLYSDLYSYPAPVDLKGQKIISLQLQAQENVYTPFGLVTYEEFGQRRKLGTMTVHDQNGIRQVLIAGDQSYDNQTISTLDSLDAGGGLWGISGGAENIAVDVSDFIRGNGSLGFDINAAAVATSGIRNLTMDSFSLSDFDTDSDSFFVAVKIADAEDITGFTMRYGIDVVNYNQITVNQTHFGTVFVSGWNLLRFDVSQKTTVGVPTIGDNVYLDLFMDKDVAKVSEIGYKFDNIVVSKGVSHSMLYYSKYGWVDAVTGAWKQDSTSDSDFLLANEDEFNMFTQKCIELAAEEVDEIPASQAAFARYERNKKQYTMDNPSDAMIITTDYQAQFYV